MAPREQHGPSGEPSGASRPPSSLPDLKYPSYREQAAGPVTVESYLAGRRADGGAEGLWRVHDKLYDLTPFIAKHPGGDHWLRVTKGTDITELFESHHIATLAASTLPRYEVRDAAQPRNSPFTFRDDGFYRTLKRRALPVLAATPDPGFAPRFNDALVVGSFVFAALAGSTGSYLAATVAALFITHSTVVAHNFTHRRDNWRMYYKSLGFMSLAEWRVVHILSHHMFANTLQDLEISLHEPVLQFLPTAGKPLLHRAASVLAFLLYAPFRLLQTLPARPGALRPEDFLPALYPAVMLLAGASVGQALLMWLYLWLAHSLFFHFIAFTVAHHHPDIFHDGDAPREDRDWGLGQLDAVRDRSDHGASRCLVLLLFGDHALHHLFPTVDHCRLAALYPVLRETLAEFGVDYRFSTTWELAVGAFRQLARTAANTRPPAGVIACGKRLHAD